jgi:hypothetical protein
MSRSGDDDKLDPIAKYKVFKKAFDTVNFFVESGNIVGAFVLSFSILEDRMKAAMVDCFNAIDEPLGTKDISKIPYGKIVSRLKRVHVIDTSLEKRLLEAADLRNRLTHQMMWRLDVFHVSHISEFKALINEIKKSHRKFIKDLNI